MNFQKSILLPVSLLFLTSCGSDNKTTPDSTEVLGDSGDTSDQPVQNDETPTEEQQKPLTVSIEKVAAWKGDAKAAYSIIHDDYPLTENFRRHYPELNKRGLYAGFGAIVEPIDGNQDIYIPKMQQMVDEGHEIINHSYSHKDVDKESTDLSLEVDHSTELLRSYGFDIRAFVFPHDHFTEAVLQRLKGMGYLGARAGGHKVNQADMDLDDPLAPFHAGFDAYFEDPATGQNTGSTYKDQDDVLKAYLDDAIQKGGWAVRELHGIEDSSWGTVSLAKYTAHLDYVVDKVNSNEVWMDTFTKVTRYRSSRAYCGEALAQDGAVVFSLSTSADCTKYTTRLSVIITTNGVDDITATQNDIAIPSKRLEAGKYMLEIDPAAGPAYVSTP
jgi:peptidoglycan/xylan/chitin deacetylase (PgdA/CDA1 family)